MKRKKELLKRKQDLIAEMEEIKSRDEIDDAELQKRAMEVERINGQLEAIEEMGGEQERSEGGPQMEGGPTDDQKKEEYRTAFLAYLRKDASPEQKALLRTMSVGTDAKGGYLIPTEMANKIVELKESASIMRKLCSEMTISHDRQVPIQGAVPSAEYIAENGTYPTGDAEFGQKVFSALKNGIIIPVSDELVDDNEFDLEGYLAKKMAGSFRALDENAFINGSGTNAPRGIILDASIGVTAAAAAALTAQEIINLIFSLKSEYTPGAKLVMNRKTLGIVRGLYEANVQVFKMELVNGKYFIEGVEVVTTSAMPDIAAGKVPIIYGDFSYYQIADRKTMDIKVLSEKYADDGQIGFRFTARNDAKLLVSEAVKALKMAAA